ncbi:MAG: heme exporter protein CcmB [Alphaproteobacteria bacterium]|nr:heme exporter protein CcmB [Alphaproteobacteria bacterium]
MIKNFLLLLSKEFKLMLMKSTQSFILFCFIIIASSIFGLALRYIQVDNKISMTVIWILLFLTVITKVEKVYLEDFSDPKIQQYMMSPFALELIVLTKNLMIYLNLVIFFLITSPIIFLTLSIDFDIFWQINILAALSLLSLVFISSITASIANSKSNRLAITSVVTLPLFIPILIFSIGSMDMDLGNINSYLFFLAYFLLNLAFSPLLTSFALKKLSM